MYGCYSMDDFLCWQISSGCEDYLAGHGGALFVQGGGALLLNGFAGTCFTYGFGDSTVVIELGICDADDDVDFFFRYVCV